MKVKFVGHPDWPEKIGSFCGVWKKGETRDIKQEDAKFLLEHHSPFFEKVE